jgi:hypothetical protein
MDDIFFIYWRISSVKIVLLIAIISILYGCYLTHDSSGSGKLVILSQVSDHGVTWTFSKRTRVGWFVTGEYGR